MKKKRKPFDRAIELGEGPRAFDLFLEFHALGAARTCPLLAEKTGRKLDLISQLCWKFKWILRANKYDQHLLQIRQRAIETQTKSEALLWAEREAQYRHDAYSFSEKLWNRAHEMLDSPLYLEEIKTTQEVTVDGKTVTV